MNKSQVPDDSRCQIERASDEADSAVRWRMLEQTIMEAGEGFSSFQADELQAIIDEAVTTSRQAP